MTLGQVPRRGFGGRGSFFAFLLLGVLLAGASPVLAVTLSGIRHSSTEDRTRIVLDVSGNARYTHRILPDPPRVVVDITDGAPAPGLKDRTVGDGYVKGVRVTDIRRGSVQVVLDLERSLGYAVFTLANPHRIVVDVRHQGGPAPKEAIARTPGGSDEGSVPQTRAPAETSGATTQAPAKPRPPLEIHPPRRDVWTIAIDAGHGGQDHGARHHRTSEKDITLALARELKEELEKRARITPILVRKGDYFIPLRRRWTLAEKQAADLFVSLHCNASEDASAMGTEVFFLSLKGATDAAAQDLAVRENAVDAKMGVAPSADPRDQILFDMIQADVLQKSEMLAETCLERLYGLGTVYGRGVKQAGFAVLKSPRMPSILVEAAFLSNRKENDLLRDGKWQKDFARRLADGIEAYVKNVSIAEGPSSGKEPR